MPLNITLEDTALSGCDLGLCRFPLGAPREVHVSSIQSQNTLSRDKSPNLAFSPCFIIKLHVSVLLAEDLLPDFGKVEPNRIFFSFLVVSFEEK